eukprot:2262883-Amphidinium_carterae.2
MHQTTFKRIAQLHVYLAFHHCSPHRGRHRSLGSLTFAEYHSLLSPTIPLHAESLAAHAPFPEGSVTRTAMVAHVQKNGTFEPARTCSLCLVKVALALSTSANLP